VTVRKRFGLGGSRFHGHMIDDVGMLTSRRPLAISCLCLACARPLAAQPASNAGRTFQLAALQQSAVQTDPRTGELALQQAQTDARLRNIAVEKLPAVSVDALAQYQSDVPTAPFDLPGGQPIFAAPKATYDAELRVDQRLFDPTLRTRAAVERGQLAENQARVKASVFAVRQDVNDAFFAAASLQQRASALAATIDDLTARLRETTARVREGAALSADAAAVEATLLQRKQDDEELRANRRAALARLTKLTGETVGENDVLELPALASAVVQARQAPAQSRTRPEYEQFARTRDRLARQGEAATAQELPQVSAFARVGYGRPGLNFINDRFETYAVGGVQVRWKAWTWGAAGREREALELQQQIVEAEQAAFAKGLGEAIENDLATIDRLQTTLSMDDRIMMLRDEIERSMKLRFDEGVVTASEYLDRSGELLQARFARAGHLVDLAQASARFLTTLGLEVR
jgi:outer membrane protein TolC